MTMSAECDRELYREAHFGAAYPTAPRRSRHREHPEIAQKATSRYLRNQRAAQRAAAKQRESEPAE